MELQQGEEILLQTHPEPNILVIWFFTRCLPLAIIALALSFWFFVALAVFFELGSEEWLYIVALAKASIAAFLALALALIYQVNLKRTYVYYITNLRCVISCGIVRKTSKSIPFTKITNIETSRHIIEKFLDISTLGIFIPGNETILNTTLFGKQKPNIAFVGLKDSQTPADIIIQILSQQKPKDNKTSSPI